MKKLLTIVAVSSLATGLVVANPTNVRASEVSGTALEMQNSVYRADDFVIREGVLYGFSKKGIETLKNNPRVVLPTLDETGSPITKVASFAFNPDKHIEIANHIEREGDGGIVNNLDVDGLEIRDLGESFGESDIRAVIIPEGYTEIGQDAFDFNIRLSEVVFPSTLTYISEYAFAHCRIANLSLPEGLQRIGDNAFFDAGIKGELVLPASLEKMGERAFKYNRISNIVFRGERLTVIPEGAFDDNNLERITIPTSIEEIGEDAFRGNTGDASYAYFVVIDVEGNPKQLEDKENYFINPTDEKKVTRLEINTAKWENSDFAFEGDKIAGFSPIGELKIKENHNLVLPDYNNEGEPITEILPNAFRNVNFEESTAKRYDIETVKFPLTLEKIGDYAFQSNSIEEFEANASLKYIGQGAFMNNQIMDVKFNKALVKIDNAAFHINQIYYIEIPENVEYIGFSAFRNGTAMAVKFKTKKLSYIGEMAFLNNSIEEIELPEGLEIIEPQTFAANKLSSLKLPSTVREIKEQAFAKNNFTEINLPESVDYLAFNTFEGNADGERKVIIHTAEGKNPKNIPDGVSHSLDPTNYVTDKEDLVAFVNKIKDLDKAELRESTKSQYEEMIQSGESLIEEANLTKSKKLEYLFNGEWFLGRLELDKAIKNAENTLAVGNGKETDKKNLERKLEYAKTAYNNYAVGKAKLDRTTKELNLLADLCNNVGEISECLMVQGAYELTTPLPIPPYYIGVNMYFKKDGKIFYILDMSYTIGEGTRNEYGTLIENVDEDNQGYHELALPTLESYEGLTLNKVLTGDVVSLNTVAYNEFAKYHVSGMFEAVKDAARSAEEELSKLPIEAIISPNNEEKAKSQDEEKNNTLETTLRAGVINIREDIEDSTKIVSIDRNIHTILKNNDNALEKNIKLRFTNENLTNVNLSRSTIIQMSEKSVDELRIADRIQSASFKVSDLDDIGEEVRVIFRQEEREDKTVYTTEIEGLTKEDTKSYRLGIKHSNITEYVPYILTETGKLKKVKRFKYDRENNLIKIRAELFKKYVLIKAS